MLLNRDISNNIKKDCNVASLFLFDHCIYALQIRDKGFFIPYHFHRSIYDIYKLDCKKSLRIKNIKKDIYIKHFFLNIAKFKIFDIAINDFNDKGETIEFIVEKYIELEKKSLYDHLKNDLTDENIEHVKNKFGEIIEELLITEEEVKIVFYQGKGSFKC